MSIHSEFLDALFVILSVLSLNFQPYQKEKSRNRYAQSYLGFNAFMQVGGGNLDGAEIPSPFMVQFAIR